MMGVPANYLFMAEEPAFATADLSSLRRAVVGGAPMPEALLDTWQRARRRDRAGVRADGGGAERPRAPARGRRSEARLRGQAVPARRRRAARSRDGRRSSTGRARESSSSAARTSSPATGGTPRRPRRPWSTAGSTPATSPGATTRATSASSAGRRTSSSRAARTSIRPRSRTSSTSTPPLPRRPSSERRTSAGARSASRSSRSAREATEEELLEFCRERLARYKVPKGVRFVDALPRNAMNKVRRPTCWSKVS